jgi:hypothetical protein
MIGRAAAVKPPTEPPSALPKVEVRISTFTPARCGVPRPCGPMKPVAWASSTMTRASKRSASARISLSLAK